MHYTHDIMLKRSSITTAFDHMTHCAWKVTKPFEHHGLSVPIQCGNAITDSASIKLMRTNDVTFLHCINFILSKKVHFFFFYCCRKQYAVTSSTLLFSSDEMKLFPQLWQFCILVTHSGRRGVVDAATVHSFMCCNLGAKNKCVLRGLLPACFGINACQTE